MENLLFEYMNRRITGESAPALKPADYGPVITISRQTGCGAEKIAFKICDQINHRGISTRKKHPWSYISRDILLQSAEKLGLDPDFVRHIVADKHRGMMDQIVEALSSHQHKSDQKVVHTIQDVIRQFGRLGNGVIVGRGGAGLCSDIKPSLHVRLEAPEEWRIQAIAEKHGFSHEYAATYVRKQDEERMMFTTRLYGAKPTNELYDLVVNRSRFSDDEIAETIIQLALIRKIL